MPNLDGFVKSPFPPIFVIPAKAGIQLIQAVLDSCFRRSDGFSDFLRDHQIWMEKSYENGSQLAGGIYFQGGLRRP